LNIDLAWMSHGNCDQIDVYGGERTEVTPVVGNLRSAHSLHPHSKVEGRCAYRVGVIEFDTRLIEPYLQHTRLKGNFEPAPASISERSGIATSSS
jgi:hypothetical protein